MNYITGLANVFGWVKNILKYQQLPTTDSSIFTILNSETVPSTILNPVDWNTTAKEQLLDLTALYKSVDYLYGQANSIKAQNQSVINSYNQTIQGLQSGYLNLKNITDQGGTSISLSAGQLDNIDLTESFYYATSRLDNDTNTGSYKLANTGQSSVVHSKLGKNGIFTIERSNFNLHNTLGEYDNVIDGDTTTYFVCDSITPSQFLNLSFNNSWCSPNNLDGFSIQTGLYLEKPCLFSEVYINPVIDAPLVVSRVGWMPLDISPFYTSSFTSIADWTVVTTSATPISGNMWMDDVDADDAIITGVVTGLNPSLDYIIPNTYAPDGEVSSSPVNGVNCLVVNSSPYSGFQGVEKTFVVSTSFLSSQTNIISGSGTGYFEPSRLDLYLSAAGNGENLTVIVTWLNGSNTLYKETFTSPTTSIFKNNYFTSYAPSTATSFTIRLGATGSTYSGYVLINSFSASLGENAIYPDLVVYKPAEIPLPTSLFSNRVSVTLTQKNPTQITGTNKFKYQIGLYELDLLFKEYIPRGVLVSKPVFTVNEIRKFWINIETLTTSSGVNVAFYPYKDDLSYQIWINPSVTYNTELSTPSITAIGDTFNIFTTEEYNAGYTASLGSTNLILLDPKTKIDIFDGTDRGGQITLNYPIHFRKYLFEQIHEFLTSYGINQSFDPNMATVFGINNSSVRDSVIAGINSLSSLTNSVLTSINGYIPIKISVSNDNFSAIPDTIGKPDDILVYNVLSEELTTANITTTTNSPINSYDGFNVWLANTTLQNLLDAGLIFTDELRYTGSESSPGIPFHIPYYDLTLTIQKCVASAPSRVNYNTLQTWYSKLAANNQLSNNSVSQVNTTSIVESVAYQTAHFPIISGDMGTAFILYSNGIQIPSNYYSVDTQKGLISLNQTLTGALSGNVTASYSYLVTPYSLTDQDWFNVGISNNQVITRNMTDYENGVTPTLKAFNNDPADPKYYPIIEYYLNSNNQVQFCRDFFKYGNLPAQITVEYDSLAIQPRIALAINRTLSPNQTAIVSNVTLNYQEIGATIINK